MKRNIIFLDGLDELERKAYKAVQDNIEELGRKLNDSKLIVTVRTGFLLRAFDTFNMYEIMPLTRDQIGDISKLWLSDPAPFLSQFDSLPYKDVADRPLVLTHLLFLFLRKGYLPQRAVLVYKKVIMLLLEDWDTQRGLRRTSGYAGFDPEQKLEFLSELAFNLLYKTKGKTFSEQQLTSVYVDICRRYKLPIDQATIVVREIQTHSGLVLLNEDEELEFSHLSLQEFLAANYIVNVPQSTRLKMYMADYPPPLAVAVSLSSEPGVWLANMVLNPNVYGAFTEERFRAFLRRLLLESPNYEESFLLGCAALRVAFDFLSCKGLREMVEAWICSSPGIVNSVGQALQRYVVEFPTSPSLDFRMRSSPNADWVLAGRTPAGFIRR